MKLNFIFHSFTLRKCVVRFELTRNIITYRFSNLTTVLVRHTKISIKINIRKFVQQYFDGKYLHLKRISILRVCLFEFSSNHFRILLHVKFIVIFIYEANVEHTQKLSFFLYSNIECEDHHSIDIRISVRQRVPLPFQVKLENLIDT
jgi:hypothetical protein